MGHDSTLREIRILGIAGSLRPESRSHAALAHALALVSHAGCTISSFDVRASTLPFCNGDKTATWPDYPAVARLRNLAREADALILATPEYHGGVSGVLKNVIDLLDFEHLEGKVVGAISVLGGSSNCNALNDVRRIMRWCHAWVIPEQIAIARAGNALTDREIDNSELRLRFERFAQSLVANTLRLRGNAVSSSLLAHVEASIHGRGAAA